MRRALTPLLTFLGFLCALWPLWLIAGLIALEMIDLDGDTRSRVPESGSRTFVAPSTSPPSGPVSVHPACRGGRFGDVQDLYECEIEAGMNEYRDWQLEQEMREYEDGRDRGYEAPYLDGYPADGYDYDDRYDDHEQGDFELEDFEQGYP